MSRWRIFRERWPGNPMWVVWDDMGCEFLFRTGNEAIKFFTAEAQRRHYARIVSQRMEYLSDRDRNGLRLD